MAREDDELIFAISLADPPPRLNQRKPAANSYTVSNNSETTASLSLQKPTDETKAINITQPQTLKVESPDFIDADLPPRVKPPISASVGGVNSKRDNVTTTSPSKLSSSANSIFANVAPIRTVGFAVPVTSLATSKNSSFK